MKIIILILFTAASIFLWYWLYPLIDHLYHSTIKVSAVLPDNDFGRVMLSVAWVEWGALWAVILAPFLCALYNLIKPQSKNVK